jgi:hypothetical protein
MKQYFNYQKVVKNLKVSFLSVKTDLNYQVKNDINERAKQ